MSGSIKTLIAQAEVLTDSGLYRRAVRLWRNIAVHPDASEPQRERAWRRVAEMQTTLAAARRTAERDRQQETEEKKARLEKDRLRILDLFSQGYSPMQVRSLTGRSRSFVFECRKKARSV